MSGLELWTWAAVVILGPGALVIFLLFLRDGRKILKDIATGDPKGP